MTRAHRAHGPVQRAPQGDVLGVELPGGGHLGGSAGRRRPLRPVAPHRRPARPRPRRPRRPGQQPGSVGAQRLQHHVPGPAVRVYPRRHQQRAVHQLSRAGPAAGPATASAPSSVNGPGKAETARNTRRSPFVQQLVTPLHGGRQRPLPHLGQPVTVGQQAEPVLDPVQQLRYAKRVHPGRGQLDGQWHPVQPGHQPPTSGPVWSSSLNPGSTRPARSAKRVTASYPRWRWGRRDRAASAAPAGSAPPRRCAAVPGWWPAPARRRRRAAACRTARPPPRSRAHSYPGPAGAAAGPARGPASRPPPRWAAP